jgi:hypothetical protein
LPSRLVIVDPETMAPLTGTINGESGAAIKVGTNAVAMDIIKNPKAEDSWDIFVAAAGGKQGTPKGNGANSTLDLVTVTFDGKGSFKAETRTLLTGISEDSNDIVSVALSPNNGAAFLLLAKIHSFDEETAKPRVTWELYSTSIPILKLLDKAPVSILGYPVQKNIYFYEEGFLWDIVFNAQRDELWMAHGNDIYIYRLTDRDPWGDPDAFCQEDINKDPFGHLHSLSVSMECQNGSVAKELGAVFKSPAVRVSSLREAVKHMVKKPA